MFLLSVILVAFITAILPQVVRKLIAYVPGVRLFPSSDWLPVLAAALFVVAFIIPDVHISSETSTFQQHFVGGGIYAACLYVYFKKLLGWKFSLLVSLIMLFAWTSAFGVANELIEFTLTKLNLAQIGTGDTDWDLLANTLGAFVGYSLLLAFGVERTDKRRS